MRIQKLTVLLSLLPAAMLLGGCADGFDPVVPGAENVQISNSAPLPDDYTEVGEIAGTNGYGCGGLGATGSYEGAESNLKQQAVALGASFVRITGTVPSHMGDAGVCFDNTYTINGIAYTAIDADPLRDANFERIARGYRDAATKPTLPEAARRFKAQAEISVSQKRYTEAYQLYGKALGVAPWWPEGHFNRALILDECGYFRGYLASIREMQRYLMLVPDAADAASAQNKIYEWELTASRESANASKASSPASTRGGDFFGAPPARR